MLSNIFSNKDNKDTKQEQLFLIVLLGYAIYYALLCISSAILLHSFEYLSYLLSAIILSCCFYFSLKKINEILFILVVYTISFTTLYYDQGLQNGDCSYLHYFILINMFVFHSKNQKPHQFSILCLMLTMFFVLNNLTPIFENSIGLYKFKHFSDITFTLTIGVLYLKFYLKNDKILKNNLITSSNMFNSLLMSSGDYVCVIDSTYRINYYNTQFERIFKNLSKIELYKGLNIKETKLHNEVNNDFKIAIDKAFNGDRFTKKLRENNLSKDNPLYNIEFSFFPIHNENDSTIAIAIIGSDVNEKQRKERDLIINEERLSNALQGSKEGVWDWDFVNSVFYISDNYKQMLGYSNHELVNRIETFKELIHPEDKDAVFQLINQHLIKETEFYKAEYRMRCKDGRYKWIESRGKVIETNADGTPRRFTGIHSDISSKKESDTKLVELKDFYENILENSPISIFVFNENTILEFANKRAIKGAATPNDIIGFSLDKIINVSKLFNVSILRKINNSLKEVLQTKKEIVTIEENLNKSGTVNYFQIRLLPSFDVSGNIKKIFVISADITELKKAEEEIIKAKNEVENALSIKQQFLSTMSHEIRTPLNGILGVTNVLIDEKPRTEQLTNLNMLLHTCKHLINLVNDILDFNKIEAGKIELYNEYLNLKDELTANINTQRLNAKKKKINFEFNYDESIPSLLFFDGLRLNQVMNNLLNNALKFTEENGTISVQISKVKQTQNSTHVRFEIKDNGIGIAIENQSKVFEMFSQATVETSKKYGGTGLGLSIVKNIIALMGSEIFIESSKDAGTTFIFTLIFGYESTKSKEIESNVEIPIFDYSSIGNLSILLAEDNPTNIFIFKKYLNKINATVAYAENGAIAEQKSNEKTFDIILMDIQMPEQDGYTTSSHIRNNVSNLNYKTPILAVTADVTKEVLNHCKRNGINGVISKPFAPEELYLKISELTTENPAIN